MIEIAAVMMIASGALHAVVNAVLKSGKDKLSSRALIDISSTVILLPAIGFVALPHGAWGWLALSLSIHAVYLVALVQGFSRGDMSATYPIMRGIAPMLAALGAVIVLDDALNGWTVAGIALVCGGIGLTAFGHSLDRSALAWSILTGCCIAGYTVVDAAGVRAAPNPPSYIVWTFVLHGLLIGGAFALWRRRTFAAYARVNWKACAIAGALSVLTYGLALWSYALGEVPELAALRESSILFGIVIAGVFLGEKLGKQRIAAGIVIFAGVAVLLIR